MDACDELLKNEPLAGLWRARGRFGIARLTSLTGLDRIGVPIYSATRADPFPESISVSGGAGLRDEEAALKALGEAIERWCAEPRGHVAIERGAERIERGAERIERIDVAELCPSAPEIPVHDWCVATGIESGTKRAVPAAAVFFPLPGPWPFAPSTTGLAFGFDRERALCSGLAECIERDAYSRILCIRASGRRPPSAGLSPSELDERAAHLAERIERAGLELALFDITGDIAVPVALAVLWEALPGGSRWTHEGIAARATLEDAAAAAILEAIQSRAVDIQGAREDLPERTGGTADELYYGAARSSAPAPRAAVAGLAELVAAVRAAGLPEPLAVTLTPSDAPGHVVRVIAPGMEVSAFDPDRIGPRSERWANAR